jgi:hypothetical protein
MLNYTILLTLFLKDKVKANDDVVTGFMILGFLELLLEAALIAG